MKKNARVIVACMALIASVAHGASEWSAAEYDLYPGDFNGDTKTDLLYVAISPNRESGIALSDGTRPIGGHQVWTAGAFGIQWHSRGYIPVIGDFNWDGRADIFMQRQIAGDHYLLLSNADGTFSGIAQTVGNTIGGLTLSGDQHRIISVKAYDSSDVNHLRGHRLFLQAVARGGSNALIATSYTGLIGGLLGSAWSDGYQGFQWNLKQAVVHSGDFNGDGNGDLLIQAKPDIILIDYDVPIPVPRYRPQSFGIVFSPIGSAGYQMWDRMTGGVDWSATQSNLAIADFDGNGRDDVLVQSRRAATSAHLVPGSTVTNQLSVTAPVSVSFSAAPGVGGDAYRIVAGNFDGGAAGGVYLQAASAGGSDLIAATLPIGGGTASTISQTPQSQAPVSTAVGSLPGVADVSATGAATYETALWVPPGINDMHPELALAYSSQSGTGHFGPGWSLKGLSAIARCQSTWAQNGVARDVRNDSQDRFCLDGNHLRRLSGNYAQPGSEYRTEIESFTRIKAYGTAGTPGYFIAERKDGLTYEYGNTPTSQVLSLGQSVARVWAVNKISDKAGNAITFTYDEDSTNGGFRINEIHYTSNTGLPARYKVRFVYEQLPVGEVHMSYMANAVIRRVSRVDRIEVSYDSALVRKYELTYEPLSTTNKSRLASIQACTPALECLPATTFTYQNGTPGLGAEAGSSITIPVATQPLSMDVNGDGRKDLVYSSSDVSGSGTWRLAFANSAGNYDAPSNTGVANTDFQKAIPFDYNADGLEDLLLPHTGNRWWVMLGTTSGLAAPLDTDVPVPANGSARAIDINGDGWQDLVYTEVFGYGGGDIIRYRLRDPANKFAAPAVLIGPLPPDSKINDAFGPIHGGAPDFNGDGRGDVMYRYTVRTWNPELVHYNFVTRLVAICPGGASFVTAASTSTSPQFGDLNGDGRTDLFYIVGGLSAEYRMRLSTGTSFTAEIPGPSANVYGVDFVLDWDSDGMDDLIARHAATDTFHVFRSLGEGLAAPVSTGIGNGFNLGGLTPVDVNGDGLKDFAYWDYGAGLNWRIRLHSGVMPDLLASVTNGFGMTTSFEYAPLTTANYQKDPDPATAPEYNYTGSTYVVSKMTSSTGIAFPATFEQNYQYRGARMNVQGRGFLGFEEVRSTDSRNGLWEYSYFHRAFPYIGARYQQRIYQPNQSTLISQVDQQWTKYDYTDGFETRAFPFVNQTTTAQYEVAIGAFHGNQVASVVQTVAVHQTTGTAYDTTTTSSELASANGAQSGAAYTQRVYHPVASLVTNESNWCLGMPGETQLINSHNQTDGGSITQTISRSWDQAKCRLNSETLQPGDPALQVVTTLTYDDAPGETDPDVGHVTKVEVAGAGMTPRITRSSWGINDGRFLRKTTDALSKDTLFDWDGAKGVPISMTDPNTLTVNWTYDSFGRRIRESRPDGTYTTWSFNRCTGTSCIGDSSLRWYVHSTQFASGGTIINAADKYFDGAGRVRYEDGPTLSGTSRVASTYDALGRLTQQTLPYALGSTVHSQTFEYDLANRVIEIERPISASNSTPQSTSISYKGLTTAVQDALGREETRVVNVWGLMARSIDTGGYYQNFAYDAFGNLKRVTDSASNTLQTIGYNVRGMKTSMADMDAGSWTYKPNALGELEYIRDAKTTAPAWTTQMTYDVLGRMATRLDVAENVTSQFNFGANPANRNVGRLESVIGGGHSESFEYDDFGRLERRTITSDGTHHIDYSYNALGLLDVLQYPTSTSSYRLAVKHEYSNGFVSTVKDNQAPGAVFWQASASDAFGNVTTERLGNGLQTSRAFDAVTGLLNTIQTVNASSASIQNLSYAWDKVGNLKQRSDLRQSLTEEFYYDNLNRLDCSTLNVATQANCAALTAPQMNLDVAYNHLGNITSKSGVGSYAYHATKKHAVTSAGSNTYGYDNNGNMNSRHGFAIDWYSYNLPKKINGAGGSSSEFFYTGARERWKQVADYGATDETTIYVGGIVEKVTLGSTISWKHYIAGGSGPVAVYTRKSTGTNETHYLTRDHLGSIDSITDSSGVPEVRLSFGAFGERRNEAGWSGNPTAGNWTEITDSTRRGFTFHEMLDNLNLTHMNGRVYDQIAGRFLSADPFVPSPEFTQSFNRYSYTFNNPLRYTDPSGFLPSPDDQPSCRPACINIDIGFSYSTWSRRWHGILIPVPRIPLRGGPTRIPVGGVECDMVPCGGGAQKRSTVKEIDYQGTWVDFALGAVRGAVDDTVKAAVLAGAVQSLFRGDFIKAYVGFRHVGSAEVFGAPDTNRGQFGYDVGPVLAAAIGGITGTARTVAARGANLFDDLVRAAQRQYPKKAGKIEEHHIDPLYLGGAKNGPTVPLDAAYHQLITNEFRRLAPYGSEVPSAARVREIMRQVYEKYPLPPGY